MIEDQFEGVVTMSGIQAMRIPVRVTLSYDEVNDPYAVAATFEQGGEASTTWIFSREEMIRGVTSTTPYGLGDVRFQLGNAGVTIRLESPEGRADILAPTDRVNDFLAKTTQFVPVGGESGLVDDELDDVLAEILEAGE